MGRYELRRRLGQGGAGVVYEAWDPELRRDVAVKLIALRSGAEAEASRLVREGQALAQLSHDHVVRVFDVGFHDASTVYLVLEKLDGGDLRDWLRKGRSVGEIVRAYLAAGRGIAAVHALGIVHRDFKPSNVLVGSDGRIAVGDFGLAKAFDRGESDEGPISSSPSASLERGITGTGSVVGTPAFMAPEQHIGDDVGPAADQFAFCASFYFALFDAYPFEGSSIEELAARKLAGEIRPPPRRVGVSPRATAALLCGLAPSPEKRHASMDALLVELSAAFSGGRTRRRVIGMTSGAALLFGVAAVVTARPACPDPAGRMHAIWNDDARAEVELALEAARIELSAPHSLYAIVPTVDGWANEWIVASTASCTASASTRHCLDRRLDAFEDILALLRETSGSTGLYAVDLVDALPAVSDCERPDRRDEWLEDPDLRAAVDHELRRLDQARALALTNRPDEARTIASEVEARATELDYPPLQALTGTLLARLDRDAGETESAVDRLVTAISIAEAHGLDRIVADAGVVLVALLAHDLRRPDEAEFWLRRTELAVARTGRDPQTDSFVQAATAAIHTTRFELPAARDAIARAAEHADNDRQRRGHLSLLCSIEASLGEHEAAATHCDEAFELAMAQIGPDHPDLAIDLANHANALHNAGDSKRAVAKLEQAIAMVERTHGATHRALPTMLGALSGALEAVGPVDDRVLAISRRAVELTAAQVGTEHPRYADEEEQYGRLLAIAGRPQDAVEPLAHAARVREQTFGPDHPRLAITLHELGDTLLEAGRPTEAVAILRRTLGLFEHMPEFALQGGETRYCLAVALWDQGERREAIDQGRAAMLELARGGDAILSADVHQWLAEHERIGARG